MKDQINDQTFEYHGMKNNYNWDNLDDCPLYGLLFYMLTDAVLMQKMLMCVGFRFVNSIIFL